MYVYVWVSELECICVRVCWNAIHSSALECVCVRVHKRA